MPDVVQIIIQTIDQSSGVNKDITDSLTGVAGGLDTVISKYLSYAAALELTKKGIDMAVDGWKAEIAAASEDQTALTQLNATLQNTGRTAEISAAQLDRMAKSPMFDPGEINAAANILARYLDIPSEQLPSDIILLENMASRYGGLTQAADALGRMLETGQLRGAGFSREMMNTISKMMSAGDVAQADTIILQRLNEMYGGQATANMNTYAGSQKMVDTALHELEANVGGLWLPMLQKGNDILATAIGYYDKWTNFLYHGANIGTLFSNIPGTASDIANGTDAENTELEKYNGTLASNYRLTLDAAQGNLQFLYSLDQENYEVDFIRQAIGKMGTSWEEMYDGAKTATDKTTMEMGLIKDSVTSMVTNVSGQGAMVWNGYLLATKQITPAAMMEFIKLEAFVAVEIPKIQSYLDRGLSVTLAVKMLQQDLTTAGIGSSPTSSVNPGDWQFVGNNVTGFNKGALYYDSKTGQYSIGIPKGAKGLDFVVPSGYPNDSYPIMAQSGEHVQITPAGKSGSSGSPINIVMNYPNQTSDPAGDMRRVAISLAATGMLP